MSTSPVTVTTDPADSVAVMENSLYRLRIMLASRPTADAWQDAIEADMSEPNVIERLWDAEADGPTAWAHADVWEDYGDDDDETYLWDADAYVY